MSRWISDEFVARLTLALMFFMQICCGRVEIGPISTDDWRSYRTLRLRAVHEEKYAFGFSYEEELRFSELEWRQRVTKMFFAKDGDKLVGMLGFDLGSSSRQKHVAYIFSFYVIPEQRGCGIGTLLFEYVLNRLKAMCRVKKIFLRVTITQNRSINFYKKFGFNVTTVLKKEYFINKMYYDVLVMTVFL